MAKLFSSICLLMLGISQPLIRGVVSVTFTFVNNCNQTVWPGISSNAGIPPLQPTGFALQKGESRVLNAPSSWGGRFWGRTHCFEDSEGKFTCATGDCGSGKLECDGGAGAPPATLAEFTLDGDGGIDFYRTSLVDGHNLPMLLIPSGGSRNNCTLTGCIVDVNGACPSALKVMNSDEEVVGCKSACVAFGREEYCCRGAYASPDTCKPTSYSRLFKTACPRASTYAYDEKTSTFTCTGADYQVTFCPSWTTSKQSNGGKQTPTTPQFSTNAIGNSITSPQSTYIRVIIGVVVVVAIIILGLGGYAIRTGNININILNGSCNGSCNRF